MVSGKVVAITGAAGALGQALARGFAQRGAAGLILGDIDSTALDGITRELEAAETAVAAMELDVCCATAVEEFVAIAVRTYGRLDVCINNAGVLGPNARIHNQSEAEWLAAVETNLMGVVHGIQSSVAVMRTQGGGSIVNTGSVAGLTAWTHSAPYGATKAAVIHLTRIAALEYAKENIRVNCVCPGSFASALTDRLPVAALDAARSRHPMGFGKPSDLVDAFAYFAGEGARWTTGSVLVVDGGYSLP